MAAEDKPNSRAVSDKYDSLMRLVTASLVAIVMAGCSPENRPSVPIARVAKAEPVPANAITLTLLSAEDLLRDGVRMKVADLPEAKRPGDNAPSVNRVPVLLEVDATWKFKAVVPVIERLAVQGRCANQGYVVQTAAGPGVIPMCIPIAYSPPGLRFIDGSREFNELGDSEQSHLWIDLHPAPLRVTGVRVGKYEAAKFYGAKPGEEIHPWSGSRPADGAWTIDMLKAFLDRADVNSERPILVISVTAEDVLGPCLKGVAELRQLGPQVVFGVPELK